MVLQAGVVVATRFGHLIATDNIHFLLPNKAYRAFIVPA